MPTAGSEHLGGRSAVGDLLGRGAPDALMQETVRACTAGAYRQVLTALPRIAGGYAYPPDGPGLGAALRAAFLARPDAPIRRTER